MKFKFTSLVLMMFFLCSFKGNESRYQKFNEWYSKNSEKLTCHEQNGIYDYDLRINLKELKVIRAIDRDQNISAKEIKAISTKYDELYEFSFKISSKGIKDIVLSISEDEAQYNEYLFYMLESISQDFTLVKESGEYKPLRCSYENNYGAAPFIKFHLVFEKVKDDALKKLKYSDQLFSRQEVDFDLSKIDHLKIPKIK